MPAGKVDRNVLASNYQEPGQAYDDKKTEGAFEVIAQQNDDNWDAYMAHKTASVMDHPDGSVQRKHIAIGAIGSSQIDPTLLQNYGDIAVQAQFAEVDAHLADIPNQTYITEKAKTVDVNDALALKSDKTYVDSITQSLANGSPKGTYATLTDLQTAFPTGNNNIYLVSADGNWYYWNGSTWTAGGVYQSTGISDGSVKFKSLDLTSIPISIWVRGGVNPTTGADDNAVGTQNVAIRTDYIKVLAGSKIINSDPSIYRLTCNLFSLQNKTWIKLLFDSADDGLAEHIVSQDCYVRVALLKNPTATISDSEISTLINNCKIYGYIERLSELEKYSDGNHWAGKTMNIIGDSITFGYFLNGTTNRVNKPFCETVADNLHMNRNNYGISGSTIAVNASDPSTHTPISARYTDMDNNADLIIVAGGTNDWYYSWTDIGTINDAVNTTFYGALNVLCNGLLEKYPKKQIVFLTPIKRITGEATSLTSVNAKGLTLKQYGEIIKQVCEIYSIPVLDMYAESLINPQIAGQATLLIPDKTHPNQDGHELMANRLTGFLKQL